MRRLCWAALLGGMAACNGEADVMQPKELRAPAAADRQYEVATITEGLGGSRSRGTAINGRGLIAGYSSFAGNQTRHASIWRDGVLQDLGTLGGPNSSVVWPGLNDRGMVVGISQTADLEPLGEEWSCSAFFPAATGTGHICRGFLWDHGRMFPLPTLGGNNGFATGVNNRGQVVGWAETPVHDPTCQGVQVLQFRAVLWEPRRGRTRQLPPYPGDSTSAATAINNRGDAVGISGDCDVAVGRMSARHAVLWHRGEVIDLGNLGGISWHTPMDINDAGDVVGFSNPPGDADSSFIAHAFLWTREGGMQDLGVLPGDETSQAFAINEHRQVVGISCGASCRAFLWENGELKDLNDLAGPGFADLLVSARDINDRGVITGDVAQASSGAILAYVAAPVRR